MPKMTDQQIADLALIASSGDNINADAALDLINALKSAHRNYARLRDAVEKATSRIDHMADRYAMAGWAKIQDRFRRAMAEQPTSFDLETPLPLKMSVKEAVNTIRAYAEADLHEHGLIEAGSWVVGDVLRAHVAQANNQKLSEAIARLEGTGIEATDVYTNHVDIRRAASFNDTIAVLIAQADGA